VGFTVSLEFSMNTPTSLHDLSSAQLAAVHDAAKQRARLLRAEAMQAFWTSLIDHVRAAWRALAALIHPPSCAPRRLADRC
jgi:hypothetical protein